VKSYKGKQRYINTKFWDDPYVIELDPSEKLLFIYLMTNTLTNIAGIYEVSLRRISFDTGFDRDMVQKILDRFQENGKILYQDGWLVIKNFIKHQKQSENPDDNINKGIKAILDTVPSYTIDFLNNSISPLQAPSKPSNYSNSNSNSNSNCNKNSNSNSKELKESFEKLWIEYPKKFGKKTAYKHYIADMKRGKNHDDILTAINNYKKKIEVEKTDPKYIKNGSTFFFNWEDFLTIELPKSKSREYTNDERKEHMKQFESKGNAPVV